jgi:putative membrane protein
MDPSWLGWMVGGSLLFWIAIVGLVVFAIIRLAPRGRGGDALAILDQRLARGEIDAEEYRARRGLIVGS